MMNTSRCFPGCVLAYVYGLSLFLLGPARLISFRGYLSLSCQSRFWPGKSLRPKDPPLLCVLWPAPAIFSTLISHSHSLPWNRHIVFPRSKRSNFLFWVPMRDDFVIEFHTHLGGEEGRKWEVVLTFTSLGGVVFDTQTRVV
jgi:hypothetical protein